MQPGTRYTRVGDGWVGYQVIGDGPRDLVFIPSWASNIDVTWEEPLLARFLRRLASFARLICFDRGTACWWLSIIVLTGIALNAAFGWWWADPVAALGMTYVLVREEGRRLL